MLTASVVLATVSIKKSYSCKTRSSCLFITNKISSLLFSCAGHRTKTDVKEPQTVSAPNSFLAIYIAVSVTSRSW
jgi:hypothetical protein